MNLTEKFTLNEIKKIESIGLQIENREYTIPDCRNLESYITDYIMTKSTKNGEITRLSKEFNTILNSLIKIQKENKNE